jgi:hypothetical protein
MIRGRRSTLRHASTWELTPRAPSSLDELLVLTGLGVESTDSSGDENLARLVLLARHDELAARVVLQRMLPGLSACARRNSTGFATQLDALDELLSEACGVIRSFPIEQRSRYVIKNLLRDCEYRAFLKARRRLLVHELTEPAKFDLTISTHEAAVEPLATMLELLGQARRAGMSEADLTLVTTLLNTSTVRQAAAALHVTDRTVRNRRHAVVRQLQALANVA